MPPEKLLVIEDDHKLQAALKQILGNEGYAISCAGTGEQALDLMRGEDFDMVLTDLRLPGIDGMEVLRSVRKSRPDTSVVMMTAYASIDSAVAAMKEGAEDYVAKPFNIDQIRLVMRKVAQKRELKLHNDLLRRRLADKYHFKNIVGNSEPMMNVFKTIDKILDTRSTVLILGESGTGKELVASAIHFNSNRSGRLFLPVNCAALNDNLIASELFGHEKGAFTGAVKAKKGIFELADGGTVFLDEIGDISPALQAILLRVLESGEIQPVGSGQRHKVDVRVIAATNRDLEDKVARDQFREDLFYRLNTITITLPPLRERKDDIGMLARHFLSKYIAQHDRRIEGILPETLALLEQYDWPGNVRELQHAVERAVLLENDRYLTPDSLPAKLAGHHPKPEEESNPDARTLKALGREHIITILKQTGWNRSEAAAILGVNRVSLWRMLKRLNITEDD